MLCHRNRLTVNNNFVFAFQGLVKEFELTVDLSKSRSGSFGFTITRSKLDNCYYIQEILDNPAKADGRLRAGDRLITVHTNTHIYTLPLTVMWFRVYDLLFLYIFLFFR